MVGNPNENIFVEFDCQNIVLVDPNKVVDQEGNVKERQLKHEELVYYANLECSLFPRTRLAVDANGNYDAKTISIASINFLKPGGKSFLTEEYLKDMTGLDNSKNVATDNTIENNTSISKKDKSDEQTKSNTTNLDTELLGITRISINTKLNFMPEVEIDMEDIRGRALFEKGENSPYAVFFNYPYPLFFLTIKGYLGKAVRYQLALRNFTATYDSDSGNFKIKTIFYAYKYNVLTQLGMDYILSLPFMYKAKYEISPTVTNNGTQTAQLSNGSSDLGKVQIKESSLGLQKIHEVYSEYKSKGLIDDNFPEITVQTLLARLELLETNLLNTLTDADLSPLTDASNYKKTLEEYLGQVYTFRGSSWFYLYLDTINYFITKEGYKIYTFKKQVGENTGGGAIENTKKKLKTDLLEFYDNKLNSSKTFGINGSYKIRNKVNKSKVPEIKINLNKNIQVNPTEGEIDFAETFIQRNNRRNYTEQDLEKLRNDFRDVTNNGAQITDLSSIKYDWFRFEGKGSFTEIIEAQINSLNTEITNIETQLTELLSDILTSADGGLGFKPTIKNVLAVLLASAEGFLRLMCEVHEKAWDVREDKNRVQAILGTERAVTSPDAKQSVQTVDGNLIPVYPWPQYFVETGNQKGEPYVIAYPGDSKYISKTKGYLYDSWPEIQFVEEFLKGKSTITGQPTAQSDSKNTARFIDRISLNALDFPLSNIIFSNKSEAKFFFEMWERILLLGGYSRFNKPDAKNDFANALADSEFLNIKESLLPDSFYLLQKLKQYGFNSSNFVGILAHVSNGGLGESWQKYIRGDFATTYIQNEVNDSFKIYDVNTITPGEKLVTLQPTEFNNIENYLKTTKSNKFDFTDTYPFCLENWFKKGLANSLSTNQNELLNTTKVLTVNGDKKMVTNFATNTSLKEVRPVTNFGFYSLTDPSPSEVDLKNFYQNRKLEELLPTEGLIKYKNYDRNLLINQTTSILNTPYFVNSIADGVIRYATGNTYPYVASAFLFLNSLPLATLREKYKTLNGTNTIDLDYIFACFKKFGAVHKLPYAWILKYGSIWHRYKVFTEKGTDILSNSWKSIDEVFEFDPITQNPNKTYNLIISGDSYPISLQNNTVLGSNNVVTMNVGFYPNILNNFSIFCRGYGLFSAYTDSTIQSKLNNFNDGFTLTYNDTSAFIKNAGYDTNNPNEILSFKPWTCTVVDSGTTKQYIVPSFGSNINQVREECFKTDGKLLKQVKSNQSVYDGSVRTFWSAPNYGYFDNSQIDIPSPLQYMKSILTGQSQQESFSLMSNSGYTYIDEIFSVFEKKVLDLMEEEFLNFSKSMYDYKVANQGDLITNGVIINELPVDTNSTNRNFQILMRQLLSTTADTTQTSTEFVTNAKNNQLNNVASTIQQFLEYDVAVKFGNPSGYDRKLFYSYATNKYIEDRIEFAPYNFGILPNQTGNPTLSQSISQNPEIWKAINLYVGFSREPGLVQTNTGSYITDFFPEMNIEVTPQSIEILAPLIKIYATQKKKNPSFNRQNMITEIDNFINDIDSFTDNVFNLLCQKIQKDLPNVKEIVDDKQTTTAVQGTQTKVDLWEKFKALNDSWISGYDYKQTTFLEDVLLMDRANRNIGDETYIDPIKVYNLFKSVNNSSSSVYSYIESVLDIHHFICMMHPAYINYYGVQEVAKNNVPRSEGTLDFANNLFGTYLNVDTRASSPKLVCTYAAEPSKYPAADKNENFRFKSDSFDFKCGGDMPLFDKLDGKQDWGLSNKVVGFNVDIGIRNQNVFNHFDVSQDSGKQTAETLRNMDDMIRQYNGKQVSTQNVSLWNFYNNRSYTSRVTCLGNAMIQPTMYFNLRYVPMFYGPYYITEVKHEISPGKFNTSFTGIRQQVFALPPLENYLQTLTKALFVDIKNQILQQKNSSSSASNTTSSVNKNQNKVLPSQNCEKSLNNAFSNYIPATSQSATTMNDKEVIEGIKQNITNAINLPLTKMLSYCTIFLESFDGTYYNCFNNNFCGVELNYQWPPGFLKYFNNQYICLQATNGNAIPYATFKTKNEMFKFLGAKWGRENFPLTAENITNTIIDNFGNVEPYTEEEKSKILIAVDKAIQRALAAGINN